jgi:putative flippase GtrA
VSAVGAVGAPAEARRRRLPSVPALRGHALFGLFFGAGLVLRILMQVGFRPAFAWPDSARYLYSALILRPDTYRPSGYSLFLRLVPYWKHLWPVSLVQHLLGLAMAVAIYAFLRRRGVPGWGAALASAPILLDPWQITLEHDVLSDVLFEALLLAGCLLLTWRRRIGMAEALAAGAVFGIATTVRSVGLLLLVPVVLAVLLGQARWRHAVAVVAMFVLPIAGYTVWFNSAYGSFSLSDAQNRQLYGRVATFVHCPGLTLPGNEERLCPRKPVDQRPGPGFYTWNARSPLASYRPTPGHTRNADLRDFTLRVLTHQPGAYAVTVGGDFLRGFAVSRGTIGYPVMEPKLVPRVHARYGVTEQVDAGLSTFLRRYGTHFWFPGPLFGLALLSALLAVCGVGRARRSGQRSAVALFGGSTLAVLVLAVAAAQFSWRYQVPEFVLAPPAAALGLLAMTRRQPDPDTLTGGEVSVRLLAKLPMPQALRHVITGEHRIRMGRYLMGSVICTVISVVTFMVAFGFGLLGSRGASLLSSATGAIAGYYLNRTWAWGKRGKADWRRELVPYWGTIVVTAVAAALVTGLVNHLVASVTDHHGVRTLFDAAAFLGTYLVSFVVKYVVFNRLFASPGRPADAGAAPGGDAASVADAARPADPLRSEAAEPSDGEPVADRPRAGADARQR